MQINCWLNPLEEKGKYSRKLEFPETNEEHSLPPVDISTNSRFPFQQQEISLEEVLDLLDKYHDRDTPGTLNARGMIDFGAFLFSVLFRDYPFDQLLEEATDLRIISECEHIHRIPWNLLALGREARFLRDADWQITLARIFENKAIKLPSLPSLLIFSPPELDNQGLTGREEHIRNIKDALSYEIRSYEGKNLLQVVDSRTGLERLLHQQHFDILYYYGHGEGNDLDSYLRITADQGSNNSGLMSLGHLEKLIRNARGGAPSLCYINACMSGSGGKMGAGLQLGKVCPAVVANRTEAWINVARRQGLDVLKQVILDGLPPHDALHNTITYNGEDSGDLSWATPILTRHYGEWVCERQPNLHHLNRQAKDWQTRLDRTNQSGLIGEYIEAVIKGSVDTLCCLWGGNANSGVDMLHDRVMHKVPDHIDLISCQMSWDKVHDEEYRDEIFRSSLINAFSCMHYMHPQNIEGIPRILKSVALHGGNHRILLHLRLQTVRPGQKDWAIPKNFQHFLTWWQRVVSTELRRSDIAVIITMGYEMQNLPILQRGYDSYLQRLNDQQLMVRLLPPLDNITKDHMRDFIQVFKLPVPTGIIDSAVENIWKSAQGDYQRSLDGLVNLYEHGVSVTAAADINDADDEDEWY